MNSDDAAAAGLLGAFAVFGTLFLMVCLAMLVVMIVSMWKVFAKAGQPGWAAIVPIYNLIVMLQIIGRPLWWIVLCLIPLVNIVVGVMIAIDLARSFGKDIGFAIGLMLLGFIFYPILGFGSARYLGPGGAAQARAVGAA